MVLAAVLEGKRTLQGWRDPSTRAVLHSTLCLVQMSYLRPECTLSDHHLLIVMLDVVQTDDQSTSEERENNGRKETACS